VALFACQRSTAESPQQRDAAPEFLSRDQLMDPETCKSCHPVHYREWASSMHAYAAQDPVFVAMNTRGQRETSGELGSFCVQCHAPLALREGASHDGLNLDEVPAKLKGVTCYVCHNTVGVGQHFNNSLDFADDVTFRAGIRDPVDTPAHGVSYGAYQDGNRRENSELCGACHDVVVPSGVHLERTFEEYESSLFGQLEQGFETCGGCHMPGRKARAAELPQAPERTVHAHLWPGVDIALTPFPGQDVQRQAVECNLALNTRIRAVNYDGLGTFTVQTETAAGHKQPSGSAQDRRMWLEVVAYDVNDEVVFESGRIADDELEDKARSDPAYDPQLALYRDWMYDADGSATHNFWEAAPSKAHPDGYESLALPFTVDPSAPHVLTARYTIARHREIVRMTLRLRIRPLGLDVLRDLIASSDLEPSVSDRVPTFTLYGAALEWRPDQPTEHSLLPADLACPKE
jgi:hypothetical protein